MLRSLHIENIAVMNGLSMLEVVRRADEYPLLSKSADKLLEFSSLIDGIAKAEASPSETVREVFERTGYRDMLNLEEDPVKRQGKIENVEELISAAAEYEEKVREAEGEPTLREICQPPADATERVPPPDARYLITARA